MRVKKQATRSSWCSATLNSTLGSASFPPDRPNLSFVMTKKGLRAHARNPFKIPYSTKIFVKAKLLLRRLLEFKHTTFRNLAKK
jgi:hypothetical protein